MRVPTPVWLKRITSCWIAGTLMLIVAGTAQSKGAPKYLDLCGPAGCARLTDPEHLSVFFTYALFPPGASSVHPFPTRYYRFRLQSDGGDPVTGYFLPEGGAETTGLVGLGFAQLPAETTAFLRTALGSLRPFSSPRVAAVYLNGRRAPSSSLYSALFARYPRQPLSSTAGPWVEIHIGWATVNPWSTDDTITYHVRSHTLLRGDGAVRVPDRLAARIVRDAGLTPQG